MIDDKLLKVIFRRLYKELGSLEIITYKDGNLYFIDREKKYWYFEYNGAGRLYWRYQYFADFFKVYSIHIDEFRWIISKWVEGVLYGNVKITSSLYDESDKDWTMNNICNKKNYITIKENVI